MKSNPSSLELRLRLRVKAKWRLSRKCVSEKGFSAGQNSRLFPPSKAAGFGFQIETDGPCSIWLEKVSFAVAGLNARMHRQAEKPQLARSVSSKKGQSPAFKIKTTLLLAYLFVGFVLAPFPPEAKGRFGVPKRGTTSGKAPPCARTASCLGWGKEALSCL